MKMLALTILAGTALTTTAALAQAPAANQAPAAAPNAQAAAQQGQTRPVPVSQIKGKDVYNQQGQSLGEVERVVVGQQGDEAFAVIKFGETLGLGGDSRMLPLSRMALRDDRLVVSGMTPAEFKGLQTYRPNQAGFKDAEPNYQARVLAVAAPATQQSAQAPAGQPGQTAADGSRIVVQQAAPTVTVDPADPRVTVRQPQPQVTVNQGQPEIIVRQPRPTVTVDIPQPEIILRMPRPDVNVAMAQPQVSVNQPRPEVRVAQPGQPQVNVEQTQPRVMVQQSGEQPNVQVQRAEGQPNVRYERAEPRVVVNQAQGQPTVRIERQDQQANARPAMTPQERERARQRLGAAEVETTAATTANARMRTITVGELDDMDAYNARGERLGEIGRVVMNGANKRFLVIESGGFLGIGEDRVAFPIERFAMQGDRLVIRGVSDADLDAMDDYRNQEAGYRRLPETERAELRTM